MAIRPSGPARLDDKDVQALLKGRVQMPGWMGDVVLKIGSARINAAS